MNNRSGIHPTAHVAESAIVDESASIAEGVVIGPHAVIGPSVAIGRATRIGAGAQLRGPTVIGEENRVFPSACIGFDPQDLKFEGEQTRLEIGDRNHFREFCTIHRGTGKGGGLTSIGDDNLFMTYSHVAHDCHVGSRTVFSNNGTLAGHVDVEDDAVIGAFSAIHQFCRVGRHAYIGGYSVITRDALPYVKTVGMKPACYGLNSIGLRRKGFADDQVSMLEDLYRLLVRSRLNTAQALERMREELDPDDELVRYWIEFVESSRRGVIKNLPGRSQRGSS